MPSGTIFDDPNRPFYEFTDKGHREQNVVYDRIQRRVMAAIKGKPVNDATKKFVRDEITSEYKALARDGYIKEVQPRDIRIAGRVTEDGRVEMTVEEADAP